MKGYKGFGPGLICRGKQYAEDTVFEESNASICYSGMHFCENPFDVLYYYGFVNDNAEINDFAEVEALDDVHTDDNVKFCTRKLRVGARIGISGLVKAFVDFTFSKIDFKNATATNTGFRSAATNTGYRSAATNTGDLSVATNTGDQSAAMNTGNRSAATNTGFRSAATNTGDLSVATNTGDLSAATNTGDWSVATNTGKQSVATNTGDWSVATNTGNRSAATVDGKESIAIVTGKDSKVRGSLGCWIVAAERDDDYHILAVRASVVDGEHIKSGVFYKLVNGEFVEC